MDFQALIEYCAPSVHPSTMMAIVAQESAYNPYSIGVNGQYELVKQPSSKQEALEVVKLLREQDETNLDIGLAQINTKNLTRMGVSIEQALDLCTNIRLGAEILTDNYRRAIASGLSEQAALLAALSEYNTGSREKGFQNGYVEKVLTQLGRETRQYLVPSLGQAMASKEKQPRALLQIETPNQTTTKPVFEEKEAAKEQPIIRGRAFFISRNKTNIYQEGRHSGANIYIEDEGGILLDDAIDTNAVRAADATPVKEKGGGALSQEFKAEVLKKNDS